jgi:hypothetical protein
MITGLLSRELGKTTEVIGLPKWPLNNGERAAQDGLTSKVFRAPSLGFSRWDETGDGGG